jgi:leucyl aminopeptidase
VDVTVWGAGFGGALGGDSLDLYSAADANLPTWTYIGTTPTTTAGLHTLSMTYTLPAGTLQAVRAHFRYQGQPSTCGFGRFDDHDDLAFTVQ